MDFNLVVVSVQSADARSMADPAERLAALGIQPHIYAVNSDDVDDDILVYQELVRRTKQADFVFMRCMSDTNRFKRYEKYENVLKECPGLVLIFSGNAEVTMMHRELFRGSNEDYRNVCRYASARGPDNDYGMMA